MIRIKQGFDKKEKRLIENILYNVIDLYGDFYVTKDNVRIYLRDNIDILFKYLIKGDRFVYEENNENGLAFITGWSDRSPRKYIKILTKDEKLAGDLLKAINWNVRCDLYCKIKKNNTLLKVFQKNQYQFVGNRGQEILLCRKYTARPEGHNSKDEEQCENLYHKNKKNQRR